MRRDAVKPWHKGNPTNLFGLAPEGKPHLVKSGRAGRHVLVCAPSNSALDELLGRLLSAGIFNRCVARCQGVPWMLGPNHRQHLQHLGNKRCVARCRGTPRMLGQITDHL